MPLKKLLAEMEGLRRRHGLFGKGDRLLVAVSGGPDSAALLALLDKFRRRFGLELCAAHLAHGISRDMSRRLAASARRLCRNLNVPLTEKSVSVPAMAKKRRLSLEEAGRIARYHFFDETAEKLRCGKIATAHTLDDQAETVLMRLLRGGGMKGLAGIPVRRRLGPREVVRPLLGSRKKEIKAFLKKEKIPYVRDRSNRDPAYFRNRVRLSLLPLLEKRYHAGVVPTLTRLAEICRETSDFLERAAGDSFRRCLLSESSGRIRLHRRRLQRLHPALRKELFFLSAEKLSGDPRRLSFRQAESVMQLLEASGKTPRVDLTGRLVAVRTKNVLEFFLKKGAFGR